jgi:RNA polymerase sigma-70 factor (ECF subfamily)
MELLTQSEPEPDPYAIYATDAEMATGLAHGHTAAVEAFCAMYTGRVRLYISARLPDASRAEHDDLTQIVVIAALKGIKNYRGNSSLLTWVLSIARNKVADALKVRVKRRLREVSFSDIVDDEDDEVDLPDLSPLNEPETAAVLSDLRGQIRQAIHILKPEFQEVLILRYVEDLQVAEVAHILGLNKRKAEYRLTEARAAFRSALVQLGMSKADT